MFRIATAAFAAPVLLAGAALAAPITTQTFDTDPILSDTQASGAWYTDRFPPSVFKSTDFMGDARLELGLDAADGAGNRGGTPFSSGFYDTQGRKFDTPGALSLQIDMYMDPLWENLPADQRVGGLWGSVETTTGLVSDYLFPIMEFINGEFVAYDTADTGTFVGLGLPSNFAYGEFATLGISLNLADSLFEYYVNGEMLGAFSADPGGGESSVAIVNAIVQGVNRPAETRSMFFDNFIADTAPISSAVPVPAAAPLLLSALGFLAFARRRRAAQA